MTPNLIELIVQAVKAEFEKEFYEKEQVFWPSQIESLIRTALASIPEMPQVDFGELIEAIQEVIRISDRKHDAWDKAKKLLADLQPFASPPTTKGAQG